MPRPRLRELGITIGTLPTGPYNAITDVPGVWVGHTTLIYDGTLNDIDAFHATKEHVLSALASAAPGPVAEGNVGGGTGMVCHEFKGGIGTRPPRR